MRVSADVFLLVRFSLYLFSIDALEWTQLRSVLCVTELFSFHSSWFLSFWSSVFCTSFCYFDKCVGFQVLGFCFS